MPFRFTSKELTNKQLCGDRQMNSIQIYLNLQTMGWRMELGRCITSANADVPTPVLDSCMELITCRAPRDFGFVAVQWNSEIVDEKSSTDAGLQEP